MIAALKEMLLEVSTGAMGRKRVRLNKNGDGTGEQVRKMLHER